MAKVAGSSIAELQAGLASGHVAPVYLIHGEEDFLVEEAVDTVIAAVLPEADRSFNLDVLDCSEAGGGEITERASSFPMMAERRVVVARDVEKLGARDLEKLTFYVEHPQTTTCLILIGRGADLRKKPFSVIHKTGDAFACKPLYENQMPAWIEGYVRRKGKKMTDEAARLLASAVGTSMTEAASELEKLFTYVGSREIEASDVSSLVGISREHTVFELQRALGEGDTSRALEIVDRLLVAGQGAPFIIVMLTSWFATLWKAHALKMRGVGDRQLGAELKLPPFFMQQYIDALRNFPLSAVESAFLHLSSADEQTKQTGASDRDILEAMILRISAGSGRR